MPRTEITADEIREAFQLPESAELTFKYTDRATRLLVGKLDVGARVPCPTAVESDPAWIPG